MRNGTKNTVLIRRSRCRGRRVGDPIVYSDHSDAPLVIAEGATVYANGKQIARPGHCTTCDANINSGVATIAETKETAQVFVVKDSRN